MMTTTHRLPSDTVVGQYLQLAVIYITRVLVAVYVAGYVTGQFIHNLNDRTTRLSRWEMDQLSRLSAFVTRLYR
jgi:hypothetical protein